MLALVIVSGFSFLASLALYKITNSIISLRVPEEQEAIGLDLSQHAEFLEADPSRQFGLHN
jgi:Amt family ammonium transporter